MAARTGNLTTDEVLGAAMRIVDEYGLADLTMRRLATHLQVQPGALYYHVANKQTLLAALADQILADLPEPHGDPVAWGMALHDLLRRHRSGAELVSAALAMRGWRESPGAALAPALEPRWGDRSSAVAAGVVHMVIGHTLDEEQRETFARLGLGDPPDSGSTDRLRGALEAWS